MTIPEILKELELYTKRFPQKAMEAAIEQREAITPELLRVLEAVAENPVQFAQREDYMLHMFALYLLAQFRDKRAYPLMVKIFHAPADTPYELAGDTVTEGLFRLFASVYDGDPTPLQGLIESDEVDVYVRGAALRSFLVLEHTGQMSKVEVIAYLRSLFHGKLPRAESFVWGELVCVVADLPAPELLPEVRQAYADDLVDTTYADLPGIERDLASPERWRLKGRDLISSAIDEMEWWAAFHPEDSWPARAPDAIADLPKAPAPTPLPPAPEPAPYVPPQPFIRGPKIGRNEPCRCGSGKKYKKCCGQG